MFFRIKEDVNNNNKHVKLFVCLKKSFNYKRDSKITLTKIEK